MVVWSEISRALLRLQPLNISHSLGRYLVGMDDTLNILVDISTIFYCTITQYH